MTFSIKYLIGPKDSTKYTEMKVCIVSTGCCGCCFVRKEAKILIQKNNSESI